MKCEGKITVPSITFNTKDLRTLIETAEASFDDTPTTNIKLLGENYKEEFNVIPDIDSFPDGLEFVEISIKSSTDIEISITLSAKEINPFSPVFSSIIVEADSSIVVLGILEKIKKFFHKRRNLHWIFHSWGIPIALLLSWMITLILYFDLRAFNIIPEITRGYLVVFAGGISFPIKFFLRWSFPYFQFKGENRFRDYVRYLLGILVVAVIGNLIYALAFKQFSLFFPK
jgi:hypothetical protein